MGVARLLLARALRAGPVLIVLACSCQQARVAPAGGSGRTISVAWDAVTTDQSGAGITDLGGYRVYYSTQSFRRSGVFLSVAEATDPSSGVEHVDVGPAQTSVELRNLSSQATYHVRLTAFGTTGAHSGFNVDPDGADTELVVAP